MEFNWEQCLLFQRKQKRFPVLFDVDDIWKTFYSMASLYYEANEWAVVGEEIVSKCDSYFIWWFDRENSLHALTFDLSALGSRQIALAREKFQRAQKYAEKV